MLPESLDCRLPFDEPDADCGRCSKLTFSLYVGGVDMSKLRWYLVGNESFGTTGFLALPCIDMLLPISDLGVGKPCDGVAGRILEASISLSKSAFLDKTVWNASLAS
jgi:hypothetical protein